jgi:carbon-monoxide dehydrogenase medium subunit
MLPRPSLPSFDYVVASSAAEVARLLQRHGDSARLLSGGTDLFVKMRDGVLRPRVVVDIKHLAGMQDVAFDEGDGLTIGAAVTMNDLATHPAVRAHYPLLAEGANAVATYQVRNRATIGGNLCNCSPCADTAPALLVLRGRMVLHGPGGTRELQAADFFRGPGLSALGADEFLEEIRVPIPPPNTRGTYLKLGRNRGGDLALVSVAVLGFPTTDTPSGYLFRVALGSVAPTPIRVPGAEEVLATNAPGEEAFALAAEQAMKAAAPIDDVRASARYRSAMVSNLTLRALRTVWASLQ